MHIHNIKSHVHFYFHLSHTRVQSMEIMSVRKAINLINWPFQKNTFQRKKFIVHCVINSILKFTFSIERFINTMFLMQMRSWLKYRRLSLLGSGVASDRWKFNNFHLGIFEILCSVFGLQTVMYTIYCFPNRILFLPKEFL